MLNGLHTTIGITVLGLSYSYISLLLQLTFGAGFFTLHTKLTGEEKR